MQEIPHFYELLWGGLTTALATVFAIMLRTSAARVKDLKERIALLEERVTNLIAALEEARHVEEGQGHSHPPTTSAYEHA